MSGVDAWLCVGGLPSSLTEWTDAHISVFRRNGHIALNLSAYGGQPTK